MLYATGHCKIINVIFSIRQYLPIFTSTFSLSNHGYNGTTYFFNKMYLSTYLDNWNQNNDNKLVIKLSIIIFLDWTSNLPNK